MQQGYLGSEPFAIEQAAHFKPVVLLLADAGYAGYANIVTTSTKLVTEKPDVVQRFIDASIEGWYSYLYGDPAPANRLIKQDNPEMPDALLSYGRDVMKTRGIVDSGDALKTRHRRDDRRALGGVLSLDGGCRRVSQGARCDEGLYDCGSWTSVSGWR